jgi:carboxypeptidase family protein/NHL repeat-containing protein
MSVLQRWGPWKTEPRCTAVILGSLLLALTLSPRAHAVTAVTVDGHPNPVTLVEGEDLVVHFDVAKPGGTAVFQLVRDLAGTGKFDPAAPWAHTSTLTDGGSGDLDPAPGKVAFAFHAGFGLPAGPYVLHLQDLSDNSTVDLPCGVAPAPQPQAISGRVTVVDANPAGSPPPDAIIWAYRDLQTPVASAHIQPDGAYTLPVPPGTYRVFAEWFGNLRSQRWIVPVAAGQLVTNLNLPLLHGQEVSGTVKDEKGQPLVNVPVQVQSAGGAMLSTQSFTDGSYVFILPNGQYTITARGASEVVTVADQPVDAVDFPPPAPAPTPAIGTIVTVAGNGLAGDGGDGGPATAARLPNPEGVALDKAGNLYIGDEVANRIRKVEAGSQRINPVAGGTSFDVIRGLVNQSTGDFGGDGGPATAARLNLPKWVAVDAAGNLYIADLRNQRVRKVDASGVITTVAGSGPTGRGKGGFAGDGGPATAALLNSPQGIALDAMGNLYIADNGNQRIRKVGLDGIITTVAGGGTQPLTDGAAATAIALSSAWGLAVDSAGSLFIADFGLNRILKMRPDGKLSFYAGNGTAGFSGDGGPATAAQLNDARQIAVDSAGNLFIADRGNQRIRKVSPDGTITTVAGTGKAGFSGDGGPALAAGLNGPYGVAIDAAGNLFFSDQGNGRVRKVIGIAAPGLVAGG